MLRTVDARTRAGKRELAGILARRKTAPDFDTLKDALPIVADVLANGEPAVRRWAERLDGQGPLPRSLVIDPSRGKAPRVDPSFVSAFRLAARRVASYHRRQVPRGFSYADGLGVSFAEQPVPHAAVGVYVPGGRAFYPSSLLMAVVPARVAGVSRVVVATPPRAFLGSPELRWAARELQVEEVLLAGGAHGIAGLVAVSGCTKIVGPGNRWVAAAKQLVSSLVSIDNPAGPSEVLVVAGPGPFAGRIAADLLAQAEHDPDATCLLFSTSRELIRDVDRELRSQIESLPTRSTAEASLAASGRAILFGSMADAFAAAGAVAAEHVQLFGRAAEAGAARLAAVSGAVFAGADTPTAFGDYVAGPNHVLPTGGSARSFSGLSTRDFFRWGRRVTVPRSAARRLAAPAAVLARFEGLEAHARALELRGQ